MPEEKKPEVIEPNQNQNQTEGGEKQPNVEPEVKTNNPFTTPQVDVLAEMEKEKEAKQKREAQEAEISKRAVFKYEFRDYIVKNKAVIGNDVEEVLNRLDERSLANQEYMDTAKMTIVEYFFNTDEDDNGDHLLARDKQTLAEFNALKQSSTVDALKRRIELASALYDTMEQVVEFKHRERLLKPQNISKVDKEEDAVTSAFFRKHVSSGE